MDYYLFLPVSACGKKEVMSSQTHWKRARWLPLVAVLGCAYMPLESSPYQDFEKRLARDGVHREALVEALGPPNQATEDYRYLLYEWEADGAFVMHPALAVFACSMPVHTTPGMNMDTLLLAFDEEGLLKRHEVVRNPRYGRDALLERFEEGLPLTPDGGSS